MGGDRGVFYFGDLYLVVQEMSSTGVYSRVERLIHRLAFSNVATQCALSDVEDRIWGARFSDIGIDRPVFITSLPRSGTTLLLEFISASPEFASHSYRHMPFLFCPMMWHALSHRFRVPMAERERAHGDGVMINSDSPEAFEEALWHAFWPMHYTGTFINMWADNSPDPTGEFEEFFKSHIRKIIALGTEEGGETRRYVSKNNVNFARRDFIRRFFPDAIFVIPFRNPHDFAASSLRQHIRFSELHAKDPFARRYTEAIGHFDFGDLLLPINISNWYEKASHLSPAEGGFWFSYWCAFAEHLLEQADDDVVLVNYEQLCETPEVSLHRLGEAIGVANTDQFNENAGLIRQRPQSSPESSVSPLMERAMDLYNELRQRSAI